MVNVFAREINGTLASLVKKLDSAVGEKHCKGFVVLMTEDSDDAAKKLKELAEKEGIKNLPLTVFEGSAGPENYKIAKDADVTVHMWKQRTVKVNHAFKAGELTDDAISAVVKDVDKITEKGNG